MKVGSGIRATTPSSNTKPFSQHDAVAATTRFEGAPALITRGSQSAASGPTTSIFPAEASNRPQLRRTFKHSRATPDAYLRLPSAERARRQRHGLNTAPPCAHEWIGVVHRGKQLATRVSGQHAKLTGRCTWKVVSPTCGIGRCSVAAGGQRIEVEVLPTLRHPRGRIPPDVLMERNPSRTANAAVGRRDVVLPVYERFALAPLAGWEGRRAILSLAGILRRRLRSGSAQPRRPAKFEEVGPAQSPLDCETMHAGAKPPDASRTSQRTPSVLSMTLPSAPIRASPKA